MVKKSKIRKKVGTKAKPKPKDRFILIIFVTIVLLLGTVMFWRMMDMGIMYANTKTATNSDKSFQIDVPDHMESAQSGINIIDYQHVGSDDSKELLSHIRVESQFIGEEPLKQTKSEITTQLKNQKGQYYDFFKQKAQSNSSAKNLNFSNFTDYSTKNVSGTLKADFSYDYDKVKVTGQQLIAFSKDTIYMITIEATGDIWQDNIEFWDNVLQSFKFNQ
ncbi:MAG TPA: hypothetical protein VD947_03235 [Patescibacteria group bacterium]|nr:hypothetical protein [Patescibacteria group bacterium]